MATEGIEALFLETHNWGAAAKFFQALGYELEFDTGHNSGQLRNSIGPPVFIAEIPADRAPGMQLVFRAGTDGADSAPPGVEVVSPFAPTHYGTREMEIRDPDGRGWRLSAPAAS